MTEHPFLVLE